MITLGGKVISDDMWLNYEGNNSKVIVESKRATAGDLFVRLYPITGGNEMRLGSQSQRATQGIWYQKDIDEIKALEAGASILTLDYHGKSFLVVIAGTNFTPFDQTEPDGECKRFTGHIILMEIQ